LSFQFAGWAQSATALWTREAFYIANELGDAAPPNEINILVSLLNSADDYEQALPLLQRVVTRPGVDTTDKIVAQKNLGRLALRLAKPSEATVFFEAAESSIAAESKYTREFKTFQLLGVEYLWAADLIAFDCKEAKKHIAIAMTYLPTSEAYLKLQRMPETISSMYRYINQTCADEDPIHR